MRIKLISVGKIKEKYYMAAIAEYAKRLSRYCKLEQIEVADEKAPENLSAAQVEQVKQIEGERILKRIVNSDYVISLEIAGKALSSEQLAQKIDQLAIAGKSQLCFIIGGSLGLSEEVRRRSNFALSFSSMTFPHQLMKVILLEQVYRSFKIIKNETYHK